MYYVIAQGRKKIKRGMRPGAQTVKNRPSGTFALVIISIYNMLFLLYYN